MPNVDVSFHYFNKNLAHTKKINKLFTTKWLSILYWLQIDVLEHKLKNVQFISIYPLLNHGHPMIDYEHMQDLFQMLKVKFVSKKHWFDMLSWAMVEFMHKLLLEATKATFVFATFIVINENEVTTIDNTQWLSIHLYAVEEDSNFALC
jgi:hypothetical protein